MGCVSSIAYTAIRLYDPSRRPSSSSSVHLFEFVYETIHDIDAAPESVLRTLAGRWRMWMCLGRRCCSGAHGLQRGTGVAVEARGDPSERFPPSLFFFVLARAEESFAPCSVGGERASP